MLTPDFAVPLIGQGSTDLSEIDKNRQLRRLPATEEVVGTLSTG
ncbi:MAG TPA: hypothetical protein PKI41_15170 [Candidatus Competibacteraceae bacterium]|nr:hypothetical protein [Candidatus Competibacteraceae bacterium]HQA26409.1 hypothetical protein [Candidatus Competibacteraceae bacterium]HQD56772.1 hypothetical protein [Candidatus Competibacteraceae bacterium]